MTAKTMNLKQSFYQFFDRMGEGVYYHYTVEYDWDDIMNNNFNERNFKIIPGAIPSEYNGYFSQYSINKKEWEKTMVEYLLSAENDMSYEDFFNNLNPEQVEEYEIKW
jgi:hypothetical protein